MKILVTGAAGFIGFYLIKSLIKEGHEVIGIDNLNSYYEISLKYARLKETGIENTSLQEGEEEQSVLYPSYRFVRMNIANAEAVRCLFEKEQFSIVCHLAAQAGVRYSIEHPATYIESNIIGFFHILENCRRYAIQHFVYASSSSVYGLNQKIPYSEKDATDHPVSLYAATKKSDELMAYAYCKLYRLPATGVRFFTVYGPWGRPDMAPIKFMKAILTHSPIQVYNYGNLKRDFTYIDDILKGLRQIIFSPPQEEVPYRIYNIGNASPVNLKDFISTIETVTGIKAIQELMPMQPGDVYETYADISLLEQQFGYRPATSIQEGLEKLYQWYISYYH